MTSAPAIAAPCSSVTVPPNRTSKVCARAAREVQRMSARTTSSEKITSRFAYRFIYIQKSNLHSFTLEEIFAKERARNPREYALPRLNVLFHPINIRESPNP